MFNVAVFRLRDILKYLVVITISILIVIAATRYFSSKKEINISINVNTVNFHKKVTLIFIINHITTFIIHFYDSLSK